MDKWIKAGVIAQIACVAISIWGVYRGEHPLPVTAPTGGVGMNPLWYGPIISGVLFTLSAILLVFGPHKRDAQKEAPPITPSDTLPHTPVAIATRKTFELLSVSQRLLVKEIYNRPGMNVVFLSPILSDFGFPPRVASDSLNRVLTTNLVERNTMGTVQPNPHVSEIVDELLKSTNLPSLEAVKSIAAETWAAVQLDAKLGYEHLVEELKDKHSRESAELQEERESQIERILRAEIDNLKKELEPARQKAARERESIAMLSKAPKLWIDFKPRSRAEGEVEKLVFSKEGESGIRIINVGPLVWTVNTIRPITLFNVVGTIRDAPVECKFTACEVKGNLTTNLYLPDLIREMTQQYGIEAQPRVAVEYEDMDGRAYSRRFVLSIDPYDRIDWEPESLELVAAAASETL
jgi:hypothetical protein